MSQFFTEAILAMISIIHIANYFRKRKLSSDQVGHFCVFSKKTTLSKPSTLYLDLRVLHQGWTNHCTCVPMSMKN